MATQCQVCGRGALKANWKSHSNIKTIRRQKINLQTKRIDGVKTMVCTSCIRKFSKAPSKRAVAA